MNNSAGSELAEPAQIIDGARTLSLSLSR